MRRSALLPAVVAFALAPFLVLNGAAAYAATTSAPGTPAPLCEKVSPNLCWRDPSDGGAGTSVVNSGRGTDQAREWLSIVDESRCSNGQVTNDCPFTPGTGLNTKYEGDAIVTIENMGSHLCAGSSLSDVSSFGVPIVTMHTCDGLQGSELSSVFVLEGFAGHFRLVSVKWSDGGTVSFVVNGDNTNDDGLAVETPGTWDGWVGAGTGF